MPVPGRRTHALRSSRLVFALSALLGVTVDRAGPALAQAPTATSRPEIAWTHDCRFDPATSRVCLHRSGAGIPPLLKFSTVMVTVPGQNGEERHLVPRIPEGDWILLAPVSEEQLCFDRRTADSICGELAAPFAVEDCGESPFEDVRSCRFRAVPFDNRDFPDFPDPRNSRRSDRPKKGETMPSYFWPPALYEDYGDTSGDVDDMFQHLAFATASQGDRIPAAAQRQLEIFAWQWFVHLNWPSDRSGRLHLEPGRKHLCPLWATWRETADVMVPPGEDPLPWSSSGAGGRRLCREPSRLTLTNATGDSSPVLGELKKEQADGNVLWDRDGAPVLYEVRINRSLYDSVVSRRLHTDTGMRQQLRWPRRFFELSFGLGFFYLPAASEYPTMGIAKAPPHVAEGAIAIKLAWKILTRGQWKTEQQERRFVTARAIVTAAAQASLRRAIKAEADSEASPRSVVTNSPFVGEATGSPQAREILERAMLERLPWESSGSGPRFVGLDEGDERPPGEDAESGFSCEKELCNVALVGMHIATRPSSQHLWSWSTFAHRANLSGSPSLLATEECGRIGPDRSETLLDPVSGRLVTHVCPAARPSEETRALNEQIRTMFLGYPADNAIRPLANYELLGTQWVESLTEGKNGRGEPPIPCQAHPDDPAPPIGQASPACLTNPVFETFHLKESCFGCHQNARVQLDERTSKRTDMMFFVTRPSGPCEVPSPGPGD